MKHFESFVDWGIPLQSYALCTSEVEDISTGPTGAGGCTPR